MVYAVILGILFGVGALACAGVAIWGAMDEGTARKCVGGILSPILFVLFLCIPFSFHQVDAGEVAVVKHMGTVSNVRTAGTYFDFWMTEKYERYDAKVQNMDIVSQAYSADGQTMDISMTIQYQIDQSKVKDIAIQYGNLDAVANKLEKVAIERAKATLSKQSAMKIIETRATVSPEVEKAIKEAVDGSYYVTVNTAVLTNIDFTDAFEATVEQKMIAEQQKLQADYENQKQIAAAKAAAEIAEVEAKAKIEVAKAEAEAKIEAARGNADAQKKIADAEAYTAQIKIVELARSLGYEVVADTYVKDEDGKDTAEVASYKVKWGEGEEAEASKKVLLAYLQYLEYLATWDGELPQIVTGADGSFLIPAPIETNN